MSWLSEIVYGFNLVLFIHTTKCQYIINNKLWSHISQAYMTAGPDLSPGSLPFWPGLNILFLVLGEPDPGVFYARILLMFSWAVKYNHAILTPMTMLWSQLHMPSPEENHYKDPKQEKPKLVYPDVTMAKHTSTSMFIQLLSTQRWVTSISCLSAFP